ncbi:Protein disulfide-isomerase A5 [Toxocara canis]|uniref:Protein disulfide-isomerase A5 n=2 Tax=Toxocara canis TaxID=6265 RepID=A0A0B2VSW0_TOXCA|nr:Protein disulfide-isomerase A5 [Toxocara canis]VDM39305.1 unnamed protein product [Toxocara canis]
MLLVGAVAYIAEVRNVESVVDHKSFKKLLRVRTNVLVLFVDGTLQEDTSLKTVLNAFSDAASQVAGIGTLALVDCSNPDGKKLCKKLRAEPHPFTIIHYHKGEYHKKYDRQLTAKSIARFMNDPTGDISWDEDPSSADVMHIEGKDSFRKLMAMDKPTLVMFYAPWCGHCKRLKPEFSAAASELRGAAILAAVDATLPNNEQMVRGFQVDAYPTLHYFDHGEHKFTYSGQHSKEGIIAWLKNPSENPVVEEPEPEEVPWAEVPSEVVHLTDEQFDTFLASHRSVLVMFYAPWCGHCKKAKPEYAAAAEMLKKEGVDGVLAAIDATVNRNAAEKIGVDGYPTFAYFKDGKFAWKINERTKAGFYKFMKNPVEPPPPELPWKMQEGDVLHLDVNNFKSELKKKRNALVMFYAPWCQYCQKAKPFFSEAAHLLSDESRIVFAAVDCTSEISLCYDYNIRGYPTIIYLSYGKNRIDYSGAHDTQSFIGFLKQAGREHTDAQLGTEFSFVEAVTTVTKRNFKELVSSGKALVMFFIRTCEGCRDAMAAFNEAAEKAKNRKFLAVDCSVDKGICEELLINEYPSFKLFIDGKAHDYLEKHTSADFIGVFERTKQPEHSEL